MAIASMAQAELCRLRQDIARIEGRPPEAERLLLDSAAPRRAFGPHERRGRLRLGLPALDALLGGGLPLAALHERPGLQLVWVGSSSTLKGLERFTPTLSAIGTFGSKRCM